MEPGEILSFRGVNVINPDPESQAIWDDFRKHSSPEEEQKAISMMILDAIFGDDIFGGPMEYRTVDEDWWEDQEW